MATTTQKHPSKAELKKASANSRIMISDWMKKNRTKRDMSQALLAELAGIDRKTINRIENGHFSPSIDTMTRVALVLGTKIPQLI